MTKATTKLRDLLARDRLLIAGGVYDGLGAKIVEEAAYEAVYISGFCVEASYGYPDTGMLTMTECVDRASVIAAATELPVICDADTGFGNAVNVVRTVRQFERAGVAAIHLEDQASPKRCGAMDGKQLIGKGEMLGKLHAALDARVDKDFSHHWPNRRHQPPGRALRDSRSRPCLPGSGLRSPSRRGPDHDRSGPRHLRGIRRSERAHDQRVARLAGPAILGI